MGGDARLPSQNRLRFCDGRRRVPQNSMNFRGTGFPPISKKSEETRLPSYSERMGGNAPLPSKIACDFRRQRSKRKIFDFFFSGRKIFDLSSRKKKKIPGSPQIPKESEGTAVSSISILFLIPIFPPTPGPLRFQRNLRGRPFFRFQRNRKERQDFFPEPFMARRKKREFGENSSFF